MKTIIKTITVEIAVSLRVGHVTLEPSWRTSLTNWATFNFDIIFYCNHFSLNLKNRSQNAWQEWGDSNPQPPVLETGALPIELHSFMRLSTFLKRPLTYSMMDATTPAPTVRPPSRIAKRKPSSIAIGWSNSTSIVILSPGITISVPAGNSTVPVTSVVRK